MMVGGPPLLLLLPPLPWWVGEVVGVVETTHLTPVTLSFQYISDGGRGGQGGEYWLSSALWDSASSCLRISSARSRASSNGANPRVTEVERRERGETVRAEGAPPPDIRLMMDSAVKEARSSEEESLGRKGGGGGGDGWAGGGGGTER